MRKLPDRTCIGIMGTLQGVTVPAGGLHGEGFEKLKIRYIRGRKGKCGKEENDWER